MHLSVAKIQNTDTTTRWQGCAAAGPSFVAGGNAYGAAASEDSFEVSHRTEGAFKHTIQQARSLVFIQRS